MLRIAPQYALEEPPVGDRSQGRVDEVAEAEVAELLSLPRISDAVWEAVDDRVADVLYHLHGAAEPHVLVYPADRRSALFREFMLDMRTRHRVLQSHGKRPWPALMQAALANKLTAVDCDALHGLTGVVLVTTSPSGFEVGQAAAGAPLDSIVFDCKTMKLGALLAALPPVPQVPVLTALTTERLRRISHEVAAAMRVQGASGFRAMTRAEQISETSRRIAEVCAARKTVEALVSPV